MKPMGLLRSLPFFAIRSAVAWIGIINHMLFNSIPLVLIIIGIIGK